MAKPELGTKRVCVACATRFFDLAKTPAMCPKCNNEQPAEPPRMRRSPSSMLDEKRRAKPVPVPGLEDADVEVETAEEEGEEDVLEDTSDLEDGADAIVEVETDTGDESR